MKNRLLPKPMIELLSLTVFLYASVVGCAFVFQRSLLYYPDKSTPSLQLSGLRQIDEISLITSDGLELLGWYRKAKPGHPTLVLFHGNAGHIGHRSLKILPYAEAGIGVLLAEYRGYGGNEGMPSEEGLYRDGHAALEFLNKAGVPVNRIVLYGESLGTGVSVQMAKEYDVGAIILEAPFTSLGDIGAHHYPYLPSRWLARDPFDNLSKIGEVSAPLLIIHGERDRIIPVDFGRKIFDAAKEPKEMKVFSNVGHNDLHLASVSQMVLEFMSRRLPPAH